MCSIFYYTVCERKTPDSLKMIYLNLDHFVLHQHLAPSTVIFVVLLQKKLYDFNLKRLILTSSL